MPDLVREQPAELIRAEREQQLSADVQVIGVAAEDAPAWNLPDAELELAVDLHGCERRGDDPAPDHVEQAEQVRRFLGRERHAFGLRTLHAQRAECEERGRKAGQHTDRRKEGRRPAGDERMHDRVETVENFQRDQPRREIAQRRRDGHLAAIQLRMRVRLAFETADQRREVAAVHDAQSGWSPKKVL